MSENKSLFIMASESHTLTSQLGNKIQSFIEEFLNLKSNWINFENELEKKEKITSIHNSLSDINNLITNLKELLCNIEDQKNKNIDTEENIDELIETRNKLLEQSKEKARKIDSLINSLQSLDRDIQTYFSLKEDL
ncbi:hypothetical protein PIROE2DRAFT_61929 [Piromyces sp. E2]|nr:hypothetical protein PIROE2DRAFT_61929 [Piromyces sp. E2]|eukprot:OUM62375.1 hypothetical protein PIROE2DRAFT_61929 [Piromyces sp. E2]